MATDRKEGDQRKNNDLLYATLAILPILAVFIVFIVLRYLRDPAAIAVALLWAGACLISGCFIGFLFGIPRVVQTETDAAGAVKPASTRSNSGDGAAGRSAGSGGYRQLVNTNLVEISDWLTKIIVGLGLVNLQKVPGLIDSAASVLGSELPGPAYAFSTALIVAFSVLGFLMGYLYTRLFLAGAFYRAAKGEELRDIVEDNVPDDGSRQVTDAQVEAARRVSASPEARDPSSIRALLNDLASQYDHVRRTMIASDARTMRMEAIVARLRTLALAGYEELPRFASGSSAGERLVAVAMLQVKPDPGYLEWLTERILTERPFIVYHALEALRRAADTLAPADKANLRTLLETKILNTDKGRELAESGTDRGGLLNRILQMLPK